jgi:hypothetical protein
MIPQSMFATADQTPPQTAPPTALKAGAPVVRASEAEGSFAAVLGRLNGLVVPCKLTPMPQSAVNFALALAEPFPCRLTLLHGTGGDQGVPFARGNGPEQRERASAALLCPFWGLRRRLSDALARVALNRRPQRPNSRRTWS